MPIYEFFCEKCKEKFEVEFFNHKDLLDYTRCPKCQKFAKRIPAPFTHYWKGKAPS